MRIVNNRNHYDNDEDKSVCDDGNANDDFDSNVIDNNGNDVFYDSDNNFLQR